MTIMDRINSYRTLLDRAHLRGYADEMLASYGYGRGPSTLTQFATHAASFGAGVAVGAGLGLLLAPQSGVETRAAIREKAGETYERVGSFVSTYNPWTRKRGTNGGAKRGREASERSDARA